MAQKDNLTVYQKLFYMFGQGGGLKSNPENNPKYSLTDKDLIVTNSREDYEKQKLQLQQQKYMRDQWQRVDSELYQKSVFYETTRLASYADFESMEFTPEIAVALDIISEEATTLDEQGKMLRVYSDSSRIKKVLEDLFYNVLDLHSNLPMWTRNLAKYGDNFTYLKIDQKHGIIASSQLTNIEIERRDSNVFQFQNQETGEADHKRDVKFIWKDKNMEFNAWEVAHFRLLGDDRKLPYGTSMLEKVRHIWRRLLLAEDAMLVYRVTRAPERRVFKVYVGNIDDNDVEAYVQKVANKFKRTQTTNQQGQQDIRYNTLAVDQDFFVPVRDANASSPIETLAGACVALDTRIPLLDGRTLELQEIIKEWNDGNRDLWVYSCDPNTGKLAPGMITWAGETRKNTEVLKITLDNGEELITTPDHKWVHRTNGFVEAKDLIVGDSLMPFYRSYDDSKNLYILDSSTQKWVNISNNDSLVQDLLTPEIELPYNHKIIKIELLDTKIDTGTITVDGNEVYHNYHTFATESGVFIKNSNLDQIADIQFIQRKLVTALRIPKPILGFDESVGDGKNLALLDIRFARTINRVQQAVIQELNKIAIIHLYILGFHDELNNFKLSLNNPSTQGEVLKVEQWKEKVLLFKDLVSTIDGGMSPTSHTWAKKNIFNWSEDEIKLDLEQQRLERAASKELEMTPEVIKKTGFFDKVDKLYGEIVTDKSNQTTSEPMDTTGGEPDMGGFGGGEPDMGDFGGNSDLGGGEPSGGDMTSGFGEGFRGDENIVEKLLLEGRKKNADILSMTRGISELLKEDPEFDDENFDLIK